MATELEQSYEFCRRVARTRARNFYYSFLLLPKERKDAMCAMYAFMRYCDDISEEAGASLAAIGQWGKELDGALQGRFSGHPVWPAFADSVRRYAIPGEYFHDMVRGVSADVEPWRVENFEQLYRYCYQVASVVGLTTIHIFGFEDPQALELAEKCGIAFQITNILRDVGEDAQNGRVYLPAEDIERFGADIGQRDGKFLALMEFEAARARRYYEEARPLVGMVDARSRAALWALIEIYRRLLKRIEDSGYDVLGKRVRVPTWEKLAILVKAKGAVRHYPVLAMQNSR